MKNINIKITKEDYENLKKAGHGPVGHIVIGDACFTPSKWEGKIYLEEELPDFIVEKRFDAYDMDFFSSHKNEKGFDVYNNGSIYVPTKETYEEFIETALKFIEAATEYDENIKEAIESFHDIW